MCFLPPCGPLLLAARQRLIHACRQRELRGISGPLCLLIECQDASLNWSKLLLHFGWGDSRAHTQKQASICSRTCTLGYSRPSICHTRIQIAQQPRTSQRSTFFPWSVKAKFHTKIPSTFYTAHKKCLALLKCLQFHVHQSRGYSILQEQLWHSAA